MLELALALVLIGGKIGGDLASRLGQPTVVGKVVIGLALGPALTFGLVHFAGHGAVTEVRSQLTLLSGLGVVWLLFLAGLETEWHQLRAQGAAGLATATGGVIVTIVLVMIAAQALSLPPTTGVLLGVALAATSVSISAQTLLEMGRLNTPIGMTILGAAVIDDLMGLVAFSLVAAGLSGKLSELPARIGMVLLFCVLVAGVVGWGGRPVLAWTRRLRTREAGLAVGFALALLLAAAAQGAGMAAITGAYVGGLALSRAAGEHLREGARVVVYSFFLPIFLVNIGFSASGNDLAGALLPGLVFTVAGIAGKVLGCGAGAMVARVPLRGAFAVGIGMIPRGEVSLVLAAFGLQSGIITAQLLAAIVIAVLATSIVSPALLRALGNIPAPEPLLQEAT